MVTEQMVVYVEAFQYIIVGSNNYTQAINL